MKIICIGRNYVEHIKELNNLMPEKPVVFLKPETALLRGNQPFHYPDISKDIHYETEIVLRIGTPGRSINQSAAINHIDAIGVGLDLTARDLQQYAKQKGLPWEVAKAFDHSAPISDDFIAINQFSDLKNIQFHLEVNGLKKQDGNTGLMIFPFEQIISYTSDFFSLEKGDLIFTGTPKGVGPIHKGDLLEIFLEGNKMLGCEIV
jgi:2-keto-4-pentenoate hydratase/2-oxohepta-3-ene-1,7-dioic acid hydratase in catechol pathway